MGKRPDRHNVTHIESQVQLENLARECREHGRFAFDTEFVMEDSFVPELCLVQIATDKTVAIIDPFLDVDLTPIIDLVCDEQVETIVHAGREDLAICVQRSNRAPRRIYDVQVAAGFIGNNYPLSLQKLVQLSVGVRLHKSKTLTDWRRRPLTEDQIRYGADDVRYLLAIRDQIEKRLRSRKRLDWVAEELTRFEEMSSYRLEQVEKLARLKGAGSLQGVHLAVLRDLLAWREGMAQQLNRPVRGVLKDHLLVEIAKHGVDQPEDVRHLRGMNLSDRHIRGLCEVVRIALALPSEQWPSPTPRIAETAGESVLVPFVTGIIRSYCLEHQLAYGLVASKKSIAQLVRHFTHQQSATDSPVELLCGWRGRTVGALLQRLFNGEVGLRLTTRDSGDAVYIRTLEGIPPIRNDNASQAAND